MGNRVERTFSYDALGRQVRAATADHELLTTYDECGSSRIIEQSTSGSAVPYPTTSHTLTRDTAGRLTEIAGPLRTVGYAYDSRGSLETVTDAALGAFSMIHDLSDRMTGLERPNGASTAVSYGPAGVLSGFQTTVGQEFVHSVTYNYKTTSNFLDSVSDVTGTTSYAHDGLGRLLSADHPAGSGVSDESYTYDGVFCCMLWDANPASEVLYDAADRLPQDADYAYTYDAEGRRITRVNRHTADVRSYEWDALGQLVAVHTVEGDWSYGYDALGRRVYVSGPDLTRTFAYMPSDLVSVMYDGAGSAVTSYVTGMSFGSVLAKDTAGVVRYALRDRLGTPVAWLDEAGQLAETVLRNSYGARVGGPSADVVPYGYTGHAEDPSGLVWGRARYLDTATGTWLSEDPVFSEPRYGYVRGHVTWGVDVDGRVAIQTVTELAVSMCEDAAQGLLGTYQTGLTVVASLTVHAIKIRVDKYVDFSIEDWLRQVGVTGLFMMRYNRLKQHNITRCTGEMALVYGVRGAATLRVGIAARTYERAFWLQVEESIVMTTLGLL